MAMACHRTQQRAIVRLCGHSAIAVTAHPDDPPILAPIFTPGRMSASLERVVIMKRNLTMSAVTNFTTMSNNRVKALPGLVLTMVAVNAFARTGSRGASQGQHATGLGDRPQGASRLNYQ